jgi:hypothetical protein
MSIRITDDNLGMYMKVSYIGDVHHAASRTVARWSDYPCGTEGNGMVGMCDCTYLVHVSCPARYTLNVILTGEPTSTHVLYRTKRVCMH